MRDRNQGRRQAKQNSFEFMSPQAEGKQNISILNKS